MSGRIRKSLWWTAAIAVAVALVACLDPTPYVLPASPAADAGPPPPDSGDAEADAVPPCEACLHAPSAPGPGCGDVIAICVDDAKCNAALACASSDGCFERGSLSQLISCGLPCATDAGILAQNDPALEKAYRVFQCAGSACAAPCGLAHASDAASD